MYSVLPTVLTWLSRGQKVLALAFGALAMAAGGCGDSVERGATGSVKSPVCTPDSDHPAPCWLTIDPGTGCRPFPDYEGCSGSIDASNPQPFRDQTSFLWLSSTPLQSLDTRLDPCSAGVCPAGQFCGYGDICYEAVLDAERASVLHGVVQVAGTPIAGVGVRLVNDWDSYVQTEWGHFDPATTPLPTPTGRFFIAVNAGAPVRLQFSKDGYFTAERTIQPVAGQYVAVPTVELVAEPSLTTVTSNSGSWQVVSGATEGSGAEARTARLFFQPNTTWTPATQSCTGTPPACSTHADQSSCEVARCDWSGSACAGTPAPCAEQDPERCVDAGCQLIDDAQFAVREYTTGSNGPSRMPGALPPTSMYTYAIEAQAKTLTGTVVDPVFDKPVIVYQENFLDIPADWTVPAGSFNRSTGRWEAQLDGSDAPLNGTIVEIIDYNETTDEANVDTDGDGNAETSYPSWMTLGERQALYNTYHPAENVSLWRVPVNHFSPWDFNFGGGLPDGAKAPELQIDTDNRKPGGCKEPAASTIDCEPQVLGESVAIPGTPYSLVYSSGRVPGYQPARRLAVRLAGSSIPTGVGAPTKLTVIFSAGGKTDDEVVNNPSGDQSFEFLWDGKDSFDRHMNGAVMASVKVGLTYAASYEPTAEFALPPGTTSASSNPTRDEFTLWREWSGTIGGLDTSEMGLGGWTLDVHKAYSTLGKTLYDGSGGQTTVQDVITELAGGDPLGIAFGPGGILYMTSPGPFLGSGDDGQLLAVHPDGSVTIVIDENEGLYEPVGIAVGLDGTVYITDTEVDQVFKWDGSTLSVVAGDGTEAQSGDGLATAAHLIDPMGVTVGPDGAVYIADTLNNKVRRLDASGYLKTVAGDGTVSPIVDGGAATTAVAQPAGLAFRADGSLCISSYSFSDSAVRCIDASGIINTVAGGGDEDIDVDGVLATDAKLGYPFGLAAGLDGSIYIAEEGTARVRRVGPDGRISTAAGKVYAVGCDGDGGGATSAKLGSPTGVAVDSSGRLYVADKWCDNVRRVATGTVGVGTGVAGEIGVPSRDGTEVYVFDDTGRHLRTEDALTGEVRFEFVYTNYEVATDKFSDLLTEIRDRRGSEGTSYDLVTEITRDTDGTPLSVIAPFGQTTTLSPDGNGYLDEVAFPNSLGTYTFDYDANGLLLEMQDPNNEVSSYEYSSDGRLEYDHDPETPSTPAYRTLSRNESFSNGAKTTTVTMTTAEGLATDYVYVESPDGTVTRSVERPDGTVTSSLISAADEQTMTLPDGTTRSTKLIPDGRFGMSAPTTESTITLVGTTPKQLITRVERVTDGGTGLYDFTTLTETRTIKKDTGDAGHTYTTVFTPGASPDPTIVQTNPLSSRRIKRKLDDYGRVSEIGLFPTTGSAEVAPIAITYDDSGRILTMQQGTSTNRRITFAYHATSGYLEYKKQGTSTDDDQFVLKFVSDDLGRVREIFRNTSATGTQFKLGFDPNSNLTSVDIPTDNSSIFRTHSLPHTSTNLLDEYDPPAVSSSSTGSSPDYAYDLDRRVETVDWAAGGKGYDIVWASNGQLDKKVKMGTSTVLVDYSYNGTTGKVSSVVAGDITTSYTDTGVQTNFDGMLGRVSTTWSSSTKSVEFNYDDYLRMATEAVTGGEAITYAYDADGLVTSVGVGSLGTIDLSCSASGGDAECRSSQSGRVQKFTVDAVKTVLGYGVWPPV